MKSQGFHPFAGAHWRRRAAGWELRLGLLALRKARVFFCFHSAAGLAANVLTCLSAALLPLPLGEGRGEGAFVGSFAAEGTLTRPAAGLSQWERQFGESFISPAGNVPPTGYLLSRYSVIGSFTN